MSKICITLSLLCASLAFAEGKDFSQSNTRPVEQTSGEVKGKPAAMNKKILTVYFSHSGNTREIAQQIHKQVGGDIFEIQTTHSYPQSYNDTVKMARSELDSGFRPKLRSKVKNIESYDIVFVGYPNWWATMPMAFFTFLSEYSFPGKTIIPFCTHEGSGLGRSVADIRKLCPQAKILDGFAVRGSRVKQAKNEVDTWLKRTGVIEKK